MVHKPGLFKFCPYCGDALPQTNNITYKFCPFCGCSFPKVAKEIPKENCILDNSTEVFKDTPSQAPPVETAKHEPKIALEHNINKDESVKKDLSIEKASRESEKNTEIKEPEKTETTPSVEEEKATVIKPSKTPSIPRLSRETSQFYSVVLKSCVHKDNLRARLEKIFIRDVFAIRLALDNIPSVIVYKSKLANMKDVINAFRVERAVISVIIGELDLYTTVDDIYPALRKMPEDIQEMMYSSPAQLWFGDNIYTCVYARMQSQPGILVVTNQGLYFLDNPGQSKICRWLTIPYYQVEKLSYLEKEAALEVFYKYSSDDVYPPLDNQRIYFENGKQSQKIFKMALAALENDFQQYY